MKLYDFIFSNKFSYRICRHLSFWSARLLFLCFWAFAAHFLLPLETDLTRLIAPLPLISVLIIDIAFCYLLVYWLVPIFFQPGKYSRFFIYFILLNLFSFIIKYVFQLLFLGNINLPLDQLLIQLWYQSITFFTTGTPVLCCLFVGIKILKTWCLKEEEKVILVGENTKAELQLLKAQVHPHFLFNTLNNIYSFILNKSSKAEGLILQLTDMVSYMVTDCQVSLVPLEKELRMLENYIGLEKVRYGERLKMQISISGECSDKLIAPLLLIPFVENSFKHGTSQMLELVWINMDICIEENNLRFNLSNSKPAKNSASPGKNGIGLKNVQKRLDLLYPKQKELNLSSGPEVFSVQLCVPLQLI